MSQIAAFLEVVPTSVPMKEKAPVENPREPSSFPVPRQGLEPRTY